MSRTVGIVVDSIAGLTREFVKKHNISVVPLKVIIGQKEYVDGEFDQDLVIQALHQKVQIRTSQPTPELFMQAYESQLLSYKEVICITISKNLSGTYNSANLAKTIINNEHVHIVDSESNVSGIAYLVERVLEFLEEGHSALEAIDFLEEEKDKGSIIFTVDNLQSLVQGGRLSRVQAIIGNILKIKPILRFKKGVLSVEHKVRSFQNVLLYIVNETKKLLEHGKVVVRIAYVDTTVHAKELEHLIYQLGEDVSVSIVGVISPVVSAHVGLGGLGVFLTSV